MIQSNFYNFMFLLLEMYDSRTSTFCPFFFFFPRESSFNDHKPLQLGREQGLASSQHSQPNLPLIV